MIIINIRKHGESLHILFFYYLTRLERLLALLPWFWIQPLLLYLLRCRAKCLFCVKYLNYTLLRHRNLSLSNHSRRQIPQPNILINLRIPYNFNATFTILNTWVVILLKDLDQIVFYAKLIIRLGIALRVWLL